MIPKEKLKVGSLYKTKNTQNEVIAYRVWLGTGWSMGSQQRRKKSFVLYKAHWADYEKAMPMNKIASSFLPESLVEDAGTIKYNHEWAPLFASKPKKTIRYLNRPEQV